MKCKYCNAEVAPNTRFCTTCGADLSKLDKCVNCGELIDREAMTCPHCGTGQPREEKVEVERNCSKKWLLLLPLIALVVGAGTWYFFSDGFSFGDSTQTTTAETVNSAPIKTDNPTVEEAKTRLKDILSAIITNDVGNQGDSPLTFPVEMCFLNKVLFLLTLLTLDCNELNIRKLQSVSRV